ncbi:hypothetical protein ID866_9788 [Astraeus odoratus]|nr:hypothetical protein ID866_9788 [Astraeus odoratus]
MEGLVGQQQLLLSKLVKIVGGKPQKPQGGESRGQEDETEGVLGEVPEGELEDVPGDELEDGTGAEDGTREEG